jgi:Predicted kinase related to dihydroxyacetone kinase
MIDGKIVISEPKSLDVAVHTLEKMLTEETEIITIIIGEDGSEKEAQKLEAALLEMNEELEVEIHHGNQPVYPYLFSAE